MIESSATLAAKMVAEAERLVDLCQSGTEEHFEASNALWALRRVQQVVGGYDDARRGAIGPPDASKRDHLRVVK